MHKPKVNCRYGHTTLTRSNELTICCRSVVFEVLLRKLAISQRQFYIVIVIEFITDTF